jgi:2-hydroxy-3-keto-5-methylthiopentenyl-1-phosphate phosphatase
MAMQLFPALAPPRPINVYVDFDGTIAPDEPTDQLFERFAGPDWKAIDEAWLAGRMSSWDATARKVSLLRASKEQIRDFLRTMPIDPDFPAFVDLCRRHGVRLTVVSDGLDLVLRTVLGAAGLILPCKANELVWHGDGRWAAAFPYRNSSCSFRLGNCKCAHRQAGTAIDVMVGDGRSDFCIAERCQLVIAKGSLLQRCREQQLPHIAMRSFADANAQFAAWMSGERATPAHSRKPQTAAANLRA